MVHTNLLKVKAGVRTYKVKVVNGYDFILSILPGSYSVLSEHAKTHIDPKS